MKPSEAIKEDNQLDAKMSMITKARRHRLYPDISLGDKVKVSLTYVNSIRNICLICFSDSKYDVEQLIGKMG